MKGKIHSVNMKYLQTYVPLHWNRDNLIQTKYNQMLNSILTLWNLTNYFSLPYNDIIRPMVEIITLI